MRIIIIFIILCNSVALSAQNKVRSNEIIQLDRSDSFLNNEIYKATAELKFKLIHTKLNVNFNFLNKHLLGEEWITVSPYFYEQENLLLDAKGMDIIEVSILTKNNKNELEYFYENEIINITLDKLYKRNEQLTLYIKYIAKPYEWAGDDKSKKDKQGLYFDTQIWTECQTESASVWFPTIDKPNQKTTQEININVPSKWVTLSNGVLINQKFNNDSTRTDTWEMNQPHAPYLFFIAAGEFSVVKDYWKGKEVSYYVEERFAHKAKEIFGMTPEMMSFYSKITGIEYPWNKYSQIVIDEIGGAMENTTATRHSINAYYQSWEDVVAHELFHQWFGNYVTAESWSNISLNESFANYGEYLWREYKYGKEYADELQYECINNYLEGEVKDRKLVEFDYKENDDLFDVVSYDKGGRILHMLRNFVGDSAFFQSLNLYLSSNKYKSAEVHQLRLSFEEITGKDLNWFFNQWFYRDGHPELEINYSYDSITNKVKVIIEQKQQNVFQIPSTIDIYDLKTKNRFNIWMKNRIDTFVFDYRKRPLLVNFDGDKNLLCSRKENKSSAEYFQQYFISDNYIDKIEAVEYFMANQSDSLTRTIIKSALNDKNKHIRFYVLDNIDLDDDSMLNFSEALIFKKAKEDKDDIIKGAAIEKIAFLKRNKYKEMYVKYISDSSFNDYLRCSSINALNLIDAVLTYKVIKNLVDKKLWKADVSASFISSILDILIKNKDYTYAAASIQKVMKINNDFDELLYRFEIDKHIVALLENDPNSLISILNKMENEPRKIECIKYTLERLINRYEEEKKPLNQNLQKLKEIL